MDGSLALQEAIIARLKADTGVSALVNGRILDHVPVDTPMPYVSLGPFQILPELADCSEGVSVSH